MKELWLTSAGGVSVRFFLRKNNAVLVVPEVVRLEVEGHLRKSLES
ncbi:MAG: hypothetical protein IPG50_25620 [Myxococcales bacterium]|nr:hypothetical protein [Myxococcales bacterium]